MKGLNVFVFLLAFVLPLVAAQEEATLKIVGVEVGTIMHFISFAVFLAASVMAFGIAKKFSGGRFASAVPYLLLPLTMLTGMESLEIIGETTPKLYGSLYFSHSIQILQLVAGFYLINFLYKVYQIKYSTEGFIAMENKKNGRRN